MKNLEVVKMVLGMVRTNCYLAVHKETKDCFIIDPADEAEKIKQKIEELGLKPEAVLLTHGHFDHIGAAEVLGKTYGIPILALDAEEELMKQPSQNLSSGLGKPFSVFGDRFLKDADQISLCGFTIQILHTPGHTAGSACYYLPQEGILFSGDTLFYESVGRTDLPTGSSSALRASVRRLACELPESTLVCPGHDMETDLGHEKMYNPFL